MVFSALPATVTLNLCHLAVTAFQGLTKPAPSGIKMLKQVQHDGIGGGRASA